MADERTADSQPFGTVSIEGSDRLLQDDALACLAISVKFYRDFLPPLYPVAAVDFVRMARSECTVELLEEAQRAILDTISFSVAANSPAAYMAEMYDVLRYSTLPRMVTFGPAPWNRVQSEVFDRLFGALYEPDVLKYPVSLLTAAALLEGLIDVMVELYAAPLALAEPVPDELEKLRRYRKTAEEQVESVKLDILELCQVSAVSQSWLRVNMSSADHTSIQEDMAECRAWLVSVAE
ncbi:hypothetical protein OE88DRAFT_1630035 [Heliocybe sulcata]|uniref:Uncharacterized protein n=1 Tax=Heliocybe sulcata TaxID=5364 RepID=A0A5C3N1U0_9AGAM|nr:hypothetical protein OE88DRAFT_1630035 [Heliocybe sulcata]